MKKIPISALLIIKILFIAIFLSLTNPTLSPRIQEIGLQPGIIFFFAVWLIGSFTFIALALLRHRIQRLIWTAIWAAASAFGLIFWLITNKEIGLADVETLIGLTAFIDNIWDVYHQEVIKGLFYVFVGAVAINMPPFFWGTTDKSKHVPWHKRVWIPLFPLLPIIPIVATLYIRSGEGTRGMPAQFNIPALLITLGIERAMLGPAPIRQLVNATPSNSNKKKHIVLVMDESIRGDMLDVNNPSGASTGLLDYVDQFANFGVASSTANCSATSNVSFRYGATRKNYLTDIKTHPSIWAYAKMAGYQTYYFDGQRHDGGLQNFMDANERKEIDEFFQLDKGTKPLDRDIALARQIRRVISDAKAPAFIFVNKMGAHFPYEGKYPKGEGHFSPTLNQSYFGTEADIPTKSSAADESKNGHLRFKNSYLNAVSWNVSGFFNELLPRIELNNIILVYTADHGQDLHEDGRKGFNTHCSSEAASQEEGRVPLLVISGDPEFLKPIKTAAKENFNNASQFNVVPSVLSWLGYDLTVLKKQTTLDADLTQKLHSEDQKFLSTYFVRLGKKPHWNPVK